MISLGEDMMNKAAVFIRTSQSGEDGVSPEVATLLTMAAADLPGYIGVESVDLFTGPKER